MNQDDLRSVLYHDDAKLDADGMARLFELYKLFVGTSERLVDRRQTVNTFFLSINALLLSGLGAIAKEVAIVPVAIVGVVAVSIAGILLCQGWRRLVHSYRQLNRGKFAVIELLEQKLPASLFRAEWEALGAGRDDTKYRPFTKTEVWIPIIFMMVYGATVAFGTTYILIRW